VSEHGMAAIVGLDKRYCVCGGAHGFDRNNDPDSAEHLSDRADHFPVHTCWLMNDGTNSKQQKASAVQSDHRAGWPVIARSACFAPEALHKGQSMLSLDPMLTLPKEKPKQAEQTFVEI